MKKKLTLIILMLLVLINTALVSTTNSYAVQNTRLEDMNPGDRIIFAGKKWILLDPSTGFILLASNDGNKPWDASNSINYETSTIKTYLNGTFLDNLGEENKALIKDITWNCGSVGHDEKDKTLDELRKLENSIQTLQKYKVGLLTFTKYQIYVNSSVLNPNDYAYWLLTSAPVSGVNFVWCNYERCDSPNCTAGIRPALYLESGTFVSPYNEIFKYENSLNLDVTAENDKTISDKDGYNTITISGTVQDGVGSGIYYRVDGITSDSGTNSGAVIADDGSFSADIDLSTVSEGDHTLFIWAWPEGTDINRSREVSRNFKVDKTGPTVSLTYEDPNGYGIYKQGEKVVITAFLVKK